MIEDEDFKSSIDKWKKMEMYWVIRFELYPDYGFEWFEDHYRKVFMEYIK